MTERRSAARCLVPVLGAIMSALLVAGCDFRIRAEPHQGLRIVSLTPSVTETLFALSAGPEVVGVSTYCDYPPEVIRLPKAGTFLTPNVEAIVAMRPDVIVGLSSSANEREIRSLKEIGFRFILVRDDSLDDIKKNIGVIGDGVGKPHEAEELLRNMHSHFGKIEQALASAPRKKVLMLVGHQPMVAVGSGTYLDELISLAHGSNIAAHLGRAWPRLSVDYVIASAPDVIIDGQMGSDASSPGGYWQHYATIPAVRNHQLYGFPENPLLRPGPRVWISLEMLASFIHPEVKMPKLDDRAQADRISIADAGVRAIHR